MDTSPNGLLVVDKPGGITSRKVVDLAQRWFGRKTRIGHAGTLDPLATGVLVLCLGNATRLVEYVQRMEKTYRSDFRLGARSDTDDADGAIMPTADAVAPDPAALNDKLAEFLGIIEQTPPAYSAAKITGTRAYDLAREGKEVSLAPKAVHIRAIEVLRYEYPELEIEVRCGKGTYIRSLARDLGDRLGCGAYVQALRRTRIGPFTAEQAIGIDADMATARERILPLSLAVAGLPALVLPEEERRRLRMGQTVALPRDMQADEGEAAILDEKGTLAAVVMVDAAKGVIRPAKVLQ
jgi:tRNA pseudouridine55 synthase